MQIIFTKKDKLYQFSSGPWREMHIFAIKSRQSSPSAPSRLTPRAGDIIKIIQRFSGAKATEIKTCSDYVRPVSATRKRENSRS